MQMRRAVIVSLAGLALAAQQAPETEVTFRSDVSLVRVDVQVMGGGSRTIPNLGVSDFALFENGREQTIRNFAREQMPVDVLLLLDVSGSMRPNIERLASASREALRVLGPQDRVAIMVFDRATRVRLPFRSSRDDVYREFDRLLDQERFNGGTDITRGMLDAAAYISRNAQAGSRRAIVILTDDQTERAVDPDRVLGALARADTVLSAILAPNMIAQMNRRQPGRRGGIIIFGPRFPGPAQRLPRTHSAETEAIAKDSGGDALGVGAAQAFQTTLSRLRQRYALYFQVPAGTEAGAEREIDVRLNAAAARRHPGAELRFRRTYIAPDVTAAPVAGTVISAVTTESADAPPEVVEETPATTRRRRTAISEPGSTRGPNPELQRTAPPSGIKNPDAAPSADELKPRWRKATPEEMKSSQPSAGPKP